jgi:hypothetical protein
MLRMKTLQKQPCLKPQDLLVALKIVTAENQALTFAQLAQQLSMSASEAHSATQRAMTSRLLEYRDGILTANRTSLREFLVHGLRYAFPAVEGPTARGMPTGISAPHHRGLFDQSKSLPWVWPDAQGQARGPSLCPLYPSVPSACREDDVLYRMLTTLDALRAGAARERGFAQQELLKLLA